MIEDIKKIEREAEAAIGAANAVAALKDARAKYLGRADGALTVILRKLGTLSVEERRRVGPLAQQLKLKLKKLCEAQETTLLDTGGSAIDATLPPLAPETGHLHPLTQVRWQLEDLFTRMGFIIADGPEVESEWYNFDALNMPSWHPARDMQDTFYVETQKHALSEVEGSKIILRQAQDDKKISSPRLVLRTHTSPVQIRAMERYGVPLRCIIPGVCFRNEATDARHENSFWQIEGLVIDRDISMAHLNATARTFLKEIFGEKIEARVRPGYFPFTEPSVEYDISCQLCAGKGYRTLRHSEPAEESPTNVGSHSREILRLRPSASAQDDNKKCPVCKGTGWLEFMGAGLVHPNVLKAGGVDPKKYSGFAFGMGPHRLVMMRSGVNDVRLFRSGDIRFLRQF
ncbi:hypothetical protein A3J43_03660 [Candidatus Uhrbacteria bacterium RIFCSPHIGHO2_12_FULL_54_23]|uniref:Phenylalanine--tRNA ligase alpha subunit n=1 Tax=Candidatus Uhrbacteria bacterium RIFCSPHIGHO2_12_FULL_54_23 TaxID=1802397 RepID=A0A1F7ULP9_9BACT|nr:MAG: hypothetical protein A3J43_03660 [Candidatus Uhrbacteria bacterium RIFCSPHIGHO2_12_FULL_54_23]